MRSFGFDRLLLALSLSAAVGPTLWVTSAAGRDITAEPSEASVQAARERYDAGVEAFRSGRFREAIAAFSAADRIAPRAALSHNIAVAYEKLGEPARALQYYRDYLFRDPAPSNGAATRERIATLEDLLEQRGVQQLTVRSEPAGASVLVDEREVGVTPWTGELAPGKHTISVAGDGGRQTRELDLPKDRAIDLDFWVAGNESAAPATAEPSRESSLFARDFGAPASVESEKPGLGAWPWVTLALGGVALGTGAVFELQRRSTEDEVARTSQLEYEDRYADMESQKRTARIFAGVGGALLVAGGVMLVIDRTERRSAAVSCGPGRCFAQMEQRF